MLANDNLCFGHEKISKSEYLRKVRALNDRFRIAGQGGVFILSFGVQELSFNVKDKLFHKIANYEFTEDEQCEDFENDMGFFDAGSLSLIWKIDCLDIGLVNYSPNPLDAKVTRRVLAVMLVSEI